VTRVFRVIKDQDRLATFAAHPRAGQATSSLS
jgi:hypothetical protein